MKFPKIIWPGSKEDEEYQAYKKSYPFKDDSFLSNTTSDPMNVPGGLTEEVLFDFLNYDSSYGSFYNRGFMNYVASDNEVTPVPKVRVKPIDVVDSLAIPPQNFLDVSLIDEKIQMFEERRELISNYYSKLEVDGLIERLKHRKQYGEHKEYFESFQVTTDEKIGELLDTHEELTRKPVELFIPDFPKEAINKMKSYTAKVKAITGKKPVFYVIAENDKFRTAYGKRDPILLAQSPFGFYWYILGAWDKEMLYLSEL